MIQIFIFAVSLGFSASAKLDHLYLPPQQGAQLSLRTNYAQLPSIHAAITSPKAAYLSPSIPKSTYLLPGPANLARVASIPILKFSADNDGEGLYSFSYETGNQINAEEQGDARGDGTKARGSYSYTSNDGQQLSITYTSDENGFIAQGAHIPTAPPIPEAILKSLQQNADAEARGVLDDGQYHGEGLRESQYISEERYSKSGVQTSSQGKSTGYSYNGGYAY